LASSDHRWDLNQAQSLWLEKQYTERGCQQRGKQSGVERSPRVGVRSRRWLIRPISSLPGHAGQVHRGTRECQTQWPPGIQQSAEDVRNVPWKNYSVHL
jgi:hypothetical protein